MNIETMRNEYNSNAMYINLLQSTYDNLINNKEVQKSIESLLTFNRTNGVECTQSFKRLIPCIQAFHNLLLEVDMTCESYYKNGTKAEATNLIGKRNELYEQFKNCFPGQQFSLQAMTRELANCILEEINALRTKSQLLKENVMDFVATSKATSTTISSKVNETTELPEKICLGVYQNNFVSKDINELDSIFNQLDKEVSVDIKNNGNIIINASSADNRSENLYNFICRAVLKYYDSFPLGALRVHFYDTANDPRFIKFVSGFRNGNSNESTKAVAEIVDKFDELVKALDNKCKEMMMNKLTGNVRDIYDLYQTDPSEYFDLVVIRNSLSDLAKSGSRANVSYIANNISSNSIGHRCGVRFIIVNDSNLSDHRIDSDGKLALETIVSNAELKLDYNSPNVMYGSSIVTPLQIESGFSDEDFIEFKCSKLAEKLSKKSQKAITYEELGCFDATVSKAGPVITIPVGKNGNEIVNIPFSCFDFDNSAEAKSIGLMVLGQSGSGKSSLYHSIIINGSLKYSPDDIQFWLLDFKNNSSAGLYSDTDQNIPHIKIVAPNSKKNDAYNLLQLLDAEMAHRNIKFNQIRSQYGKPISNLFEYNEFIDQNNPGGFVHLPHIVLMIDEVQELFRDDGENFDGLYKQIGELINKVVSKGRSSGIHMAMFGQNLDAAKTYTLKDNFINQSISKACFKLAASSVSNSGYGNSFIERKNEIEALGVGEIYLAYSNVDVKKCRVAYANSGKLISYLTKIVQKNGDVSSNVLKIGVTEKLSPRELVSGSMTKYMERVLSPTVSKNGIIKCTVGEDAYSLKPLELIFDPGKSSSAFLVGNGRGVATSLLASLLLSACKLNAEVHVCRGMLREDSLYNVLIKDSICNVHAYNLVDIDKCISNVYQEYKKRRNDEDQTGDFDNTPIFAFLNDFDAQEKIKQNVSLVESNNSEPVQYSSLSQILQNRTSTTPRNNTLDLANVKIKDAIKELVENAYEYNVFFVILLKEEWYREFESVLKASKNVILFNDMSYSTFSSKNNINAVLKDIKQEPNIYIDEDNDGEADDSESFAIKSMGNDVYSKFRPIIYNSEEDMILIKTLLKEN